MKFTRGVREAETRRKKKVTPEEVFVHSCKSIFYYRKHFLCFSSCTPSSVQQKILQSGDFLKKKLLAAFIPQRIRSERGVSALHQIEPLHVTFEQPEDTLESPSSLLLTLFSDKNILNDFLLAACRCARNENESRKIEEK